MKKLKRIALALLLAVTVLPLPAQEKADSSYVFRFVAKKNMFFSPYNGNGTELNRLLEAIEKNRTAIEDGRMYLLVESYGTTGNASQSAEKMAKIRRNRVKSELIVRGKVKESHFVTNKAFAEPYQVKEGELRNVVVVILPAPAEKVAELAGEEAAAKVEAYNNKVTGKSEPVTVEQQPTVKEETAVKEEANQNLTTERETEMPTGQAGAKQTDGASSLYTFALRANLLRWATLTPDIGIEWRITPSWGILVNGSWTSWSWDNKNRRYALWEVAPEVRYYIGKEKRGYLGAMYKAGSFNYKLSDTGRQGDQPAIDFMVASKVTGKSRTDYTVPFVFAHKLSKIEMKIEPGADVTATDLAGITVNKTAISVTSTITDWTPGNDTGSAE